MSRYLLAACSLLGSSGCGEPPAPVRRDVLTPMQRGLVTAARNQLSWGTKYDGRYARIAYPHGDVPKTVGVCTDVVIRAFRPMGYDLQKLVHEDIVSRPSAYPSIRKPDTNIDHRRVPNLVIYFRKHALDLPRTTNDPEDWQPGDIVSWKLANGKDHIGLLSDHRDGDGFPLVIHNIGPTPSEDNVLRESTWQIRGHFRFPR